MSRKKKKNVPKRRRKPAPTKPTHVTPGVSENTVHRKQAMLEMVKMLAEAGAPDDVLQSAAEAHNAAQDGDLEPLFAFFKSIGLDPDRIAGGSDDPFDDEDWDIENEQWYDDEEVMVDPLHGYPMSSLQTAVELQENECVEHTTEEAVAFLRSVLAQDPQSVEVLLMLGIESHDDSQTVEFFHRACEIGGKSIRESPELTPHLIEYRHQMGWELVQRGRLVEALEVLQPAMEEDERDGAGVRFLIIDLMLRLGWWDELGELLDRRPDDGLGPGMFAKAILLHHLDANSKEAVNALKAAHEFKPLVAPLAVSSETLPATEHGHYSLGSHEEAVILAGYLKPGLRANPGTTRWIRDTLQLSLDPVNASGDGTVRTEGSSNLSSNLSSGDLDKALGARQVKEVWAYHGRKISSEAYVSMVLKDDTLIGLTKYEAAPKSRELRQFILDTVCEPIQGRRRRPAKLVVASKATLNMLRKAVGTYGVDCECIKPSAFEKGKIRELSEHAARFLEKSEVQDPLERTSLDIDELPVCDSSWLTAVLQPPMWIGDQSTPSRPYVQMVCDASEGFVLKSELTESPPSSRQQAEVLADAMQHPMMGSPRCPKQIVLHPEMDRDTFAGSMQELVGGDRVEIALGDQKVVRLFETMIIDMTRSGDPIGTAMIELDGVDADLLRKLYQSAARFYQQAPWNLVGGDQLISVSSGATDGTQWGASVMGQLGQAMGLSLIQGINEAKAMILEQTDISSLLAISIQFDEAFDVPPLELLQIEKHDWEIANDEAFPVFLKIVQGDPSTSLNADEIRMIIEVMNHLPAFLQQDRDKKAIEYNKGASSHLELQWIDI